MGRTEACPANKMLLPEREKCNLEVPDFAPTRAILFVVDLLGQIIGLHTPGDYQSLRVTNKPFHYHFGKSVN
jgi:hypothetical protein